MNCGWRYVDLIKSLELEYSMSWEETIFDVNKILVLPYWKPAFSLKANSCVGGYQRFFSIFYTYITNFGKHLRKHWLLVKLRLSTYVFTGYGIIGQIIVSDISRHLEPSIKKCSSSTLAHWIVWHSLKMIHSSKKLYVF